MNWGELLLALSSMVWVFNAMETRKIWVYGLTVLASAAVKTIWEKL